MVPTLLGILAAVVTAFVLQPVFSKRRIVVTAPETPADRERLRLLEKREQLLLALSELDFEHDAGKVAEPEHQEIRRRLLAETARATARLDEIDR